MGDWQEDRPCLAHLDVIFLLILISLKILNGKRETVSTTGAVRTTGTGKKLSKTLRASQFREWLTLLSLFPTLSAAPSVPPGQLTSPAFLGPVEAWVAGSWGPILLILT